MASRDFPHDMIHDAQNSGFSLRPSTSPPSPNRGWIRGVTLATLGVPVLLGLYLYGQNRSPAPVPASRPAVVTTAAPVSPLAPEVHPPPADAATPACCVGGSPGRLAFFKPPEIEKAELAENIPDTAVPEVPPTPLEPEPPTDPARDAPPAESPTPVVAGTMPATTATTESPASPRRVRVVDPNGRTVVARIYGGPDSDVVLLPDGQLGWPREMVFIDEPFMPDSPELVEKTLVEGPYQGFQSQRTDHYVILYNCSKPFADDSARLLESLYKGLLKTLGENGVKVHEAEFPSGRRDLRR